MFNKIQVYIKKYSDTLFVVDEQKLSKGSKSLLVVFVMSIFMIIGWGLSWQKEQTKSPYKLYGYECTHLVNKKDNIDFDYFKSRNYYISLKQFGDSKRCNQLGKYYISFIKGNKYQEALKEIKTLESLKYTLDKRGKKDELNTIIEDIKSLKTLNNYPKYLIFNKYYQENRELIKSNCQAKMRLYHFKQTLQAFGFLFPIWLVFYLVYKFTLKRKHFILANLTINVANVSALYALFYLIDFIYTIIPKIFLEKLIAIFMKYNLTIILNTIVIIFFIIVFGILIYMVQRNHSTSVNKRKDEIKNLTNGKCSECGCVINGDYCQICGFKHYSDCVTCGVKRLSKANFCQHCGESFN
jgi:hypothetical protein